MTTKLYQYGQAAVTVRDPDADGFQYASDVAGASERMINGTMRMHTRITKRRWQCRWSGLTSAEYATLKTELERRILMTFQPPDTATTYSVVVTGDVQGASDGYSYSLTATIEEA